MLYSGHLFIADTFCSNQLSPAIYFEPLYSGHLFIADTFSENQWCLLLRVFTVLRNESVNCVNLIIAMKSFESTYEVTICLIVLFQ